MYMTIFASGRIRPTFFRLGSSLIAVAALANLALSASDAAAFETPSRAVQSSQVTTEITSEITGAPNANLSTPASADDQLLALMAAEYDWKMQDGGAVRDTDGTWGAADRLPNLDIAAQKQRIAHWKASLSALNAIDAASLSPENRINASVLRTLLDADLANAHFKSWEMPLNSDSNFWTYLDSSGGLLTVEDYRRYLARMRDLPRYFDQHITHMRAGLARGFSVPRISLMGRDKSISAFVTDDAQSNAFYAAFRTMPSTIPAAQQASLRAEAEQVIRQSVVPAYAKLLNFYQKTYVPRTRTSISVQDLPDGAAYYAAQIKEYTTLDLSAEQIHKIGLAEVARINADMQQTMKDSGFTGSFDEFLTFLRTDPQFYAKTGEELLMVSAYVAKRVDGKLGETIGLLPRRRFTILPVADALAPFYTAGRGGLEACWMNTHNLPSRPLYNIPALTLHECSPGHSLQAALAEESDQGPMLRRSTYFSGFGEGWGLYTEWLGIGMGIYRTPYEHFGRQSYEMWRAARLVIDTGLHQHGWTRDQAIAYLANHTALSQHEVETEVDRYISWPGQALAYKLGEMTIRRLRQDAETALGEKFDQRRFHDVILGLGSVPLPVLEDRIAQFIAAGGQ